jgi:hypothetical protein
MNFPNHACLGLSDTYLLVIILIIGLKRSLGNSVQITLAGLCDPSAALILILLKHTNLLKSLHHLAVDGAGCIDMVGRAGTPVLSGAVKSASATPRRI